MKCYLCGENFKDKGPNRKKKGGIWIHKACPAEAARRKASRKAKREEKKCHGGE